MGRPENRAAPFALLVLALAVQCCLQGSVRNIPTTRSDHRRPGSGLRCGLRGVCAGVRRSLDFYRLLKLL